MLIWHSSSVATQHTEVKRNDWLADLDMRG